MENNLQPSIDDLQQRINNNPCDSEAFNLLGIALSEQRRWQEAVLAWQQALRLDPDNDNASFAIVVAITGENPFVVPTTELLHFLDEHTDGFYVKMWRSQASRPSFNNPEASDP